MSLQATQMIGLVRIWIKIKEDHKRKNWQCLFKQWPERETVGQQTDSKHSNYVNFSDSLLKAIYLIYLLI